MIKFDRDKYSLFLIFLLLSSYFLGFYLREITNGAGHIDLEHFIWLIVIDLKQDYLL